MTNVIVGPIKQFKTQLCRELTTINCQLSVLKRKIACAINTDRRLICRSVNPNDLTPEEVFNILKHKNGWFGSTWGDDVCIKWDEHETDTEYASRIANDTNIHNQLVDQYADLKQQRSRVESQLIHVNKLLKSSD